jgi:hypothetical protein
MLCQGLPHRFACSGAERDTFGAIDMLRLRFTWSGRMFGMVRMIASVALLLLYAGCQAGALPTGTAKAAREPQVQLWGPPDNFGGTGDGGGGGPM